MSGVLESLQRRLVGSLHSQLAKDESGQRMVVLGADDSVDENQGLQEAHKRARAIGARRKAVLIIWGSRAGESRFFPRITIVPQTNEISLSGEQTLMVQDIHELSMPDEDVAQPIYLAHFLSGYSFYNQRKYKEALTHVEPQFATIRPHRRREQISTYLRELVMGIWPKAKQICSHSCSWHLMILPWHLVIMAKPKISANWHNRRMIWGPCFAYCPLRIVQTTTDERSRHFNRLGLPRKNGQ
jgi:hypothetical protein